VDELEEFLRSRSVGDLLPWPAQHAAAIRFELSPAEIEEAALALGLLPSRYQRNRECISLPSQLTLRRSRVAVIGCGGLGGYVIEELARLGVGTLVAIDPDFFQEHNLNRQILSTQKSLGLAKVAVAAARVAEINPAVNLIAIPAAYTPEGAAEMLAGVAVVVDALDAIPIRLALARDCCTLGLPLVHGAIAGWYGQVTTQFPGDDNLERLYGRSGVAKGIEQQLGNPSFTPAIVASLETAEVCKLLLGAGTPLRSRNLFINLLDMSFEEVAFETQARASSPGTSSS